MSTDVTKFGSIERAVLALLLANYVDDSDQALSDHEDRVGGDLSYQASMPYYIRIDSVGGSSDRFEGDFIVDIETFSDGYGTAESVALGLEALLLGYPHVVEVDGSRWVFDTVYQNASPHDIFWDDESTSRLAATYVITARRRR